MEVNSTWLITSELANQRARKALFTCVVYTKYEYIGYIRIHRSNIQWQEGNKHKMYFSFTFQFHMCADHVLRTHACSCKCHTRGYHTQRMIHKRTPYACLTRANKPERSCDMIRRCVFNKRYCDDCTIFSSP